MGSLQLALAIWGIGAVAAFPATYELGDPTAGPMSGLQNVIASVASALLWPLAWLAMLAFGVLCACRWAKGDRP